jgi:predicted ATPase
MRCHHLRVVVLIAALLSACSDHTIRIDGTSPASFAESHRRLVNSLSLADQTRLMLAETVIRAAATPKPSGQAPGAQPEIVPLEAVRAELNGKTFDEIIQLSKSVHTKVKVGFITQPAL